MNRFKNAGAAITEAKRRHKDTGKEHLVLDDRREQYAFVVMEADQADRGLQDGWLFQEDVVHSSFDE